MMTNRSENRHLSERQWPGRLPHAAAASGQGVRDVLVAKGNADRPAGTPTVKESKKRAPLSWPRSRTSGMRPPMARPCRCWFAGVLTLATVLGLPQRSTAQTPSPAPPLPVPLRTNEGENETARSAAFSGAMRAWGAGTTAMFLNPANLAETSAYHIEGVV